MLFNSYVFLFLFFPIVLGGYFFLGSREKSERANLWLVLASFAFYGYWNVCYLPLLLGSILVNYLISGRILAARDAKRSEASPPGGDAKRSEASPQGEGRKAKGRAWFLLGLFFNLALLGYYKYLDFFLDSLNWLGAELPVLHILLPFGISFFTITQLLYLLDCQAGVAKDHSLAGYALFVSFFPHLLAGPILYHKPMMAQFRDASLRRVQWENMSRGLTLMVIGLAKKVLIADSFSAFVGTGFHQAESLAFVPAWLTILAYMMQIYYDFSGYSDMAVGMARMMNIKIPINFNSPYRAGSLINFWQRWHISLTNAITACIYLPMVRSFRKPSFGRTLLAMFVTFFIVGIWHGAGWNYVVFALMHGVGMAVNYAWKQRRLWMPKLLGHGITILYVIVSMVFFRAADLHEAWQLLQGMAGWHGGMPWPVHAGADAATIRAFGDALAGSLGELPLWTFLLAAALVIWCPNSNELVKRMRFTAPVALAVALLFAASVCCLDQPTEFLYLQF